MNPEPGLDGLEVVRGLIRVSSHLSSHTPLRERMQLLCRETAEILQCDRTLIMVWDGEYYNATYHYGHPPDIVPMLEDFRMPGDLPLTEELVRTRNYVLINDARAHPYTAAIAEQARIESLVVAPLVDDDGDPLGFMTAEFNERIGGFDDQRAEIVLGAARLAQGALISDRERRDRKQADRGRRQLLEQLINAEDRERQRIARDIHDEPLQQLFALSLSLETLARKAEGEDRERLQLLVNDIRTAGTSLRAILQDIHPTQLEMGGLANSLRASLERKAEFTDWAIELIDHTTDDIPPSVASVLYRISYQAIQNAAQHADATKVTVDLRTVKRGTEVRISDDGVGFDPTAVDPSRFGLVSMTERAELAGGRIDIDGRVDGGTRITVWVPHVTNEPRVVGP